MPLANSVINARVQRGVRFLDRAMPEWFKQIDLNQLDMEDGSKCILGQCHGDFFEALQSLTPVRVQRASTSDQNAWAQERGFTVCGTVPSGTWERLAYAWAMAVAYRQMKARLELPRYLRD